MTQAVARPTQAPVGWLLAICALSILFKVALTLATHTWNAPKTWEYETIAVNLVEGRGFRSEFLQQPYRSEVQPVYPVLCAALYKVFGYRHSVVQVAQFVLSTLLCGVVYGIGRRLFSIQVGLWAAALVAVHPGLSYYAAANLHVLPVDALLFALVVWSFIRLHDAALVENFLLGGVILGVAVLSRASILVFVPAGLWWLWIGVRGRMSGRALMIRTGLLLATAALIVSPWLLRNYRLYKRPFYFLSTVGSGLWTGNNPHATGSTLTREGVPVRYTAPSEFLNELYRRPELEQDELFRHTAIRYMKAHPLETLRLFARKFAAFWWFTPQSGSWYPRSWLALYGLWYTAMLMLMGFGLWAAGTSAGGWRVAIVPIFGLFISLCQSLFYVEGRHRWEVEAVLLVLAAAGLNSIREKVMERWRLSSRFTERREVHGY